MVAIYARQSIDRPDSISIETQIAKCRAHLRVGDADNCRVYEDRGFSGKSVNRPGLQALLRDIEGELIDQVIAYKIDRISRSVHDFTGLCALLQRKRVAFQSCEDGITLDDTPAGIAMAQILMVFAQFERETILRRVTDNYYERARLGMYLGGRPPFGFDKGETTVAGRKTAYFVPNYIQAAVVSSLYARYAEEDVSLGVLMRWLNEEQRTPTATGGTWSTVQLGRLLHNPAYVRADAAVYRYLSGRGAQITNPIEEFLGLRGCYLYAGRHTPDGAAQSRGKFSDLGRAYVSLAPHDGLIDSALWLAVQHKLDRNRALKNSGAGKHSWLSGLMKCAFCGYAVTVVHKADGTGHYINCGGRKKGATVCPGRSTVMTLEQIEQAVEAQLLPYLASYASVPPRRAPHHQAQANRLEMQLAALDDEIARLTRNLAQIDLPDVVALTAQAIHEKQQTRTKLQDQKRALFVCDHAETMCDAFTKIAQAWPAYSIARKKSLARTAIERVMIGDGAVEICFAAGYGDRSSPTT